MRNTFVQDLKDTMGVALGVDTGSITVTGLRPAEPSNTTLWDVEERRQPGIDIRRPVTGPDAMVALITLSEQVADPNSALRAAGITNDHQSSRSFAQLGHTVSSAEVNAATAAIQACPTATTTFAAARCVPGEAPRSSHPFTVRLCRRLLQLIRREEPLEVFHGWRAMDRAHGKFQRGLSSMHPRPTVLTSMRYRAPMEP